MHPDGPAPKTAKWFRRDAERNESARLERLRIDGRKSVGQNIEEGAALIVLGFEMQRAFEHTRRLMGAALDASHSATRTASIARVLRLTSCPLFG